MLQLLAKYYCMQTLWLQRKQTYLYSTVYQTTMLMDMVYKCHTNCSCSITYQHNVGRATPRSGPVSFKRKWQAKLALWVAAGKGGAGAGQAGLLASSDVKQATLWALDALRDIPDEVIKNCWQKVGILPFEVNQRYIEDKEKVSKGDAQSSRSSC